MSIKTILAIVVVAALAAAGWFFRDSPLLRGAATSTQAFVKDVLPDNSYTAAKPKGDKPGGKAEQSKGPHALRKCVSETRTVYTDEACPPGSREAPISEGNVTVMPGQRAAAQPKGEEKAK